MKKSHFIILCILAEVFTAFGQTAEPENITISYNNDDKPTVGTTIEMNEPTRRTKRTPFSVHTGFTVSALAANNMFSAPEFFKKKLIIDLNKLSKSTMNSGLHEGVLTDLDLFFQFTVSEEHTVRFSTTAHATEWINIPKSLLDLAANGNVANSTGKTIDGILNASLSAFVDTGILYQLKKSNYGFSVRAAYFIPIAYMENPQGKYRLAPHKSGGTVDGLILEADGTADIYGYVPARAVGRPLSVTEILKNGGFDVSLTGSYSPTDWVSVTGGVDYLPLVPVTMEQGIRNRFAFKGSFSDLLGVISGTNKEVFGQHVETDILSSTLPKKRIMRPCKIRVAADFKPFHNDYFILSPAFAFPVINAKPYYIDGGLKIESRFAKVLGVYLDSSYIERMWRHELCFFIDSRWCSFMLAASVASHDFKRTFTTLSGVGLKLGFGIGF